MDLEEIKGLRSMRNSLVHARQKNALEVIDWLIAEVERLTNRLAEYKREAQKSYRREADLKAARDRAESKVKELTSGHKPIVCPSCGSNYTSPFDIEESDTTRRCGHCGEVFEEAKQTSDTDPLIEFGTARRRCQGYAVLLDGIAAELDTVPVNENDEDPAKSVLFMIGAHIATFGDRPESVLDDSDYVGRLTERIDELESLAYNNGELYNKEYLRREDAEAERDKYKTALAMYADKSRWSRAWGDDEALLYNIREDGGEGWSIAQAVLAKTVQPRDNDRLP